MSSRPGTLLDFRSQDLAEQLTLLDSELFYKIKVCDPPACVHCIPRRALTHLCVSRVQLPEVLMWSKEQNEEKSLNLNQFTQHFNSVSFW